MHELGRPKALESIETAHCLDADSVGVLQLSNKEVIGGLAIRQAASKAEAVELTRQFQARE